VKGTVDDFLSYWLPLQAQREVSQHHITNHSVEVSGDTAHAETYFLFFRSCSAIP
jgi:ribosome-binding factor A